VSTCRGIEVAGRKNRDRSRKTHGVSVSNRTCGLKAEWARDRIGWRGLIGGLKIEIARIINVVINTSE